MAWTLHREATQEDWDRLTHTCADFIRKYGHGAGMVDPESWVDLEIPRENIMISRYVVDNHWDEARVRAILRKRIRRALRHPWAEGIAYEYVGWWTA